MSHEMLGKEVKLDYSAVLSQFGFLEGKVLTIIDASFSEPRQLKAVKDLVRKMFSEQRAWVGQICHPEVPFFTREQATEMYGDLNKIEIDAEKA